MLQLKKLGIDDLVHFDFMDPPGTFSNGFLGYSRIYIELLCLFIR